jgi:uroporphyrinogen-III synthase
VEGASDFVLASKSPGLPVCFGRLELDWVPLVSAEATRLFWEALDIPKYGYWECVV